MIHLVQHQSAATGHHASRLSKSHITVNSYTAISLLPKTPGTVKAENDVVHVRYGVL